MTSEMKLEKDEIWALLWLNEDPDIDAEVLKRLAQIGYIGKSTNGYVITSLGKRWINANIDTIKEAKEGRDWFIKQTSKGKWL